MTTRKSKRAGRPRLEAKDGDVILSNESNERRSQIRRAQRTYRLKKEATFQNAISKAEDLEARIRIAGEEVAELARIASDPPLQISHPDMNARIKRLHEILVGNGPIETSTPATHAESAEGSAEVQLPELNEQVQSYRKPPLLLQPTSLCTYAFQEASFARQLQRYCLEYAYRLFTQPGSDPREIYRLFRLVPCVKDPGKTEPRFRQLLMGGCTDPLEVPGLPFYNIGGAGCHFPNVDEKGNAIYPGNIRLPRRVLGMLPGTEPGTKGFEETLGVHGLSGEWFDSRDVEGYLRRHGVDVNGGLSPAIHMPGGATQNDIQSYVLDVQGFFSRLLSGLVILGRAPGFRKTDVRHALQASVKKIPTSRPLSDSH